MKLILQGFRSLKSSLRCSADIHKLLHTSAAFLKAHKHTYTNTHKQTHMLLQSIWSNKVNSKHKNQLWFKNQIAWAIRHTVKPEPKKWTLSPADSVRHNLCLFDETKKDKALIKSKQHQAILAGEGGEFSMPASFHTVLQSPWHRVCWTWKENKCVSVCSLNLVPGFHMRNVQECPGTLLELHIILTTSFSHYVSIPNLPLRLFLVDFLWICEAAVHGKGIGRQFWDLEVNQRRSDDRVLVPGRGPVGGLLSLSVHVLCVCVYVRLFLCLCMCVCVSSSLLA